MDPVGVVALICGVGLWFLMIFATYAVVKDLEISNSQTQNLHLEKKIASHEKRNLYLERKVKWLPMQFRRTTDRIRFSVS